MTNTNSAIRRFHGVLWNGKVTTATTIPIYKSVVERKYSYVWLGIICSFIDKRDMFKIMAAEMIFRIVANNLRTIQWQLSRQRIMGVVLDTIDAIKTKLLRWYVGDRRPNRVQPWSPE